MIEDEELDIAAAEMQKEKSQNAITTYPETNKQFIMTDANALEGNNVVIETAFSKKMDEVKENVLVNASTSDDKFVDTVKKNVKEAAVKLTEVEKQKAEHQEHLVQYEDEKLDTKRKKNVHEQASDKWDNKRKARQFHYDGVKPIMEFVNITEPMNIFILYFLVIILSPVFLLSKLIKGTFGALLTGASDKERSKTAKGFLWTLLCLFALLTLFVLVCLFLKSQGLDIFAKIKF